MINSEFEPDTTEASENNVDFYLHHPELNSLVQLIHQFHEQQDGGLKEFEDWIDSLSQEELADILASN